MKNIYLILDDLNISYREYHHDAVFTGADEIAKGLYFDGAARSKNLFIRNKKKTKYYLIILDIEKRVDMKSLQEKLNESHLSFASPADLMDKLSITPGSVSPFTLIHNDGNDVEVIVDHELYNHEQVSFHPNDNTKTLVISREDFEKFLVFSGNPFRVIDF